MAIAFQSVLIGWEVYLLTGSKLMLGFIGLTEAIPSITISLYGGHIADKSEKKSLFFKCLMFYVFLSFTLIFLTHKDFIELIGKQYAIIGIYSVIFLTGIARGFAGPASFSLATFLIPKEDYQNGTTWSSAAWQMGAVFGPAFAGILYGFIGITYTFILQLILLLIALYMISRIKPKPILNQEIQEKIWDSIKVGLRFVFNHKIILYCISLDLFAVLFGGAMALLPVYAKDILKVGPTGLGIMRAMPALGAIITMIYVAFVPIKKNAGNILLVSVAGFGIFMILFGVSTSFVFSLFCLMMSGALDGISVIIRQTILQLKTPMAMRGRVAAVNSMFVGSSNEIGEFESGVAAKMLGTVPSVVFGGIMTILVVIFTYFKAPSLRTMELKADDD